MKKVLFGILIFCTMAALVFVGLGDDIIEAQSQPVPPVIQYQMIPIPGAEPAECAGQAACVTMCFYIHEDTDFDYHWELSCTGMILAQ